MLLPYWPLLLFAQPKQPIVLSNPSFEDIPAKDKAPAKWFHCRIKGESPPDVQPGQYSVSLKPIDGSSYLGLVVRDNETFEAVSQRLALPLEQGQCYDFSIDAAHSPLYMSLSATTGKQVNFVTPAKLRIWGGNGFDDRREMLAETPPVRNNEWQTHYLRLQPKKGTYRFLVLEAYYKTPVIDLYNGHILLDNASDIRPANCDRQPAKAAAAPVVARTKKTAPGSSRTAAKEGSGAIPSVTALTPTEAPQKTAKIDRKSLKKGSIIQLEHVYFDVNRWDIKSEVEPTLKWLADFLRNNPDIYIEVGGHTSNNPTDAFANELSEKRAKAVANWLIQHGSPVLQVSHKGYGKTRPLVPNTDAAGRSKNQRVEITILNISN